MVPLEVQAILLEMWQDLGGTPWKEGLHRE